MIKSLCSITMKKHKYLFIIILLFSIPVYADDFDEMFEFFGLDNNVTSIPPREKVFNENIDLNINVRLKKVTYSQNNIQFYFTLQNKEINEINFYINPESIIIINGKDEKLQVKGEPFSKIISKDLDYFSVVGVEETEISEIYNITLPIEFGNVKMEGNINFIFKNISIK